MKKQRGYLDGLEGAFAALLVVAAIAGACIYAGASWGWPTVKAWLHAITA